jgi:ElaB/YqjD/DUF883 family membrane-anchored ribosome-binding protein
MLSNTKAAAARLEEAAHNDIREHLHVVAEKSAHMLDDTLDKASAYATDAGRKVRRAADKATSRVKSVSERVTDEIKQKPVQSSLIALGAGIVVGALISKK